MRSKEVKRQSRMGFTLVELLVAITILGIILVIAIPQVINIQNENKTTKYVKYSESLQSAAKLYTDSYSKDMFGNNSSGCYDIKYSSLKAKNLAKDIKVDGAKCEGDSGTYVKVLKSNDNYSYQVAIKCVNSSGNVLYEKTISGGGICDGQHPDEETPGVVITPNGHDWYNGKKSGTADKVAIKVSDQYGMMENTTIEYAWLKEGESKDSLTYTKKDFKNKRGEGMLANPLTVTVEVPQGVSGQYTLVVKTGQVRDANGNYMNGDVESKVFKLDNVKPTIPNKSNSSNSNWTNQNITITATATDEHSGIDKLYYTYANSNAEAGLKDNWKVTTPVGNNISVEGTWASEIDKDVYLIAVDKAGNQSNIVPVGKVRIDTTAPSVTATTNSGNGNWTNQNITITANATDARSNIKKIYYTYSATATSKKYEDWQTNNTTSVSRIWSGEGSSTVYIIAEDAAGNLSTFKNAGDVKIDKTPPTTPTTGAIGAVSGTNTSASIKTAAGGSTDINGSGVKEYRYYVKKTTGTPAKTDVNFKTSRAYTRACGTTYYAYAIAVDNAGNKSNVKGLGTTSDGADKATWGACSSTCGTGTQKSTNTCALKNGATKSCTSQTGCCTSTKTTWGAWSSCKGSCGTGTQTRTGTKYSTINSSVSCGTQTESRSCDTGVSCCSKVNLTYGAWSSCSVSCGAGTKTRTVTKKSAYNNGACGTYTETQSCEGPSCGKNNCNIRGGTKVKTPYTWKCSAGHSHTTAYIHYCSDANGKLWNKNTNSTLVKYQYVCPTSPISGQMVINDPQWSLNNFA